MNNIRKAIIPAALLLAGLSSVEAQAANTSAGIQITNSASMSYEVNGATQATVNASASLLVDARVALGISEQGGTVENTAQTYEPDGAGNGQYYRVGVFQISNTGNIKTVYDLTLSNVTNGNTVNAVADSQDAASLSGFRIFNGTGFVNNEITATNKLTIDRAPDLSNGTTAEVYVYAPVSQITGINNDAYAFNLQVDATQLIERLPGDDGDATAKNLTDYTVAASGPELNTVELQVLSQTANADDIIKLAFPDFTPDPTDPTNSGFTKTAVVVWDPINEATSPKALPGAVVKYTITIKNLGAVAASNMTVSDPLPANATYCTAAPCAPVAALTSDTQAAEATYPLYDNADNTVKSAYASFGASNVATIVFYVTID